MRKMAHVVRRHLERRTAQHRLATSLQTVHNLLSVQAVRRRVAQQAIALVMKVRTFSAFGKTVVYKRASSVLQIQWQFDVHLFSVHFD